MNKQNQWAAMSMVQRIFLVFSLLLGAVPVHAQNSIESVSGSIQGGQEVIRIDLAQPLTADPVAFLIQSPARIALDFPGVSNAMGR